MGRRPTVHGPAGPTTIPSLLPGRSLREGLPTPPVVGLVGHPQVPTDLVDRLPLRRQHLRLTQLADDLLGREPLPAHDLCLLPWCPRAQSVTQNLDSFPGGRSGGTTGRQLQRAVGRERRDGPLEDGQLLVQGRIPHGQGSPVGLQGPKQNADRLHHAYWETALPGWKASIVAAKSGADTKRKCL